MIGAPAMSAVDQTKPRAIVEAPRQVLSVIDLKLRMAEILFTYPKSPILDSFSPAFDEH